MSGTYNEWVDYNDDETRKRQLKNLYRNIHFNHRHPQRLQVKPNDQHSRHKSALKNNFQNRFLSES